MTKGEMGLGNFFFSLSQKVKTLLLFSLNFSAGTNSELR